MRKILLTVIFLLLFMGSQQVVLAQEASPTVTPKLPSPTPVYELAYPGLLPDNALYPLKAFRDRLIGFLITDPVKKATFDLLQADKRLGSAVYLLKESSGDFSKNPTKGEIAVSTISKGENYFEEAVGKVKEAQKEGRDAHEIEKQLLLASAKHRQILMQLSTQTKSPFKEKFAHLEKRMAGIQKQVMLLK